MLLLLLVYAAALVPTTPIETHVHEITARDLTFGGVFPGLYFGPAYSCGENFVYSTTDASYDGRSLLNAAYDSQAACDGPFEQIFGKGWDGGSAVANQYAKVIWGNMNASLTYPFVGDPSGRFTQTRQLGINCREVVAPSRCGIPGRRVLAYVIQASGDSGPQMTICPDLYDNTVPKVPKKLYDVGKGAPITDISRLMTTGHVIAHEWMHVTALRHPSDPIKDLSAKLPSCNFQNCSVYGHSRCDEFAHLYGPGIVNPSVIMNADNYAWWATGAYFAQLWNICPSKFLLKARDDDAGGPDNGFALDQDDGDPLPVDNSTVPTIDQSAIGACSLDTSTAGSPKVTWPDQGTFAVASASDPDPPIPSNAPPTDISSTSVSSAPLATSAPPATSAAPTPTPGSWRDAYGPVAAGSFTFFILPRDQQDYSGVANVTHCLEEDGNGPGYVSHPFVIACASETADQYFQSGTTLPYGLTIQAGHACATGIANRNLDGLHVSYANQYLDVTSDSSCVKHDLGVSCVLPLRP